jgi:membrane associated rhomboid family serine protease
MKQSWSIFRFASATQLIVLVNVLVYAIQILMQPASTAQGGDILALLNLRRITDFELTFALLVPPQFPGVIWQVFTSMFLHGSIFHIFINMWILWQFGQVLEQVWGPNRFLKYYLLTGIGSGITVVLLGVITNDLSVTLGASGAVFGLLLAFGMLFPNHTIYLFFALPLPAKYAVIIFGVLELLFLMTNALPGISHIGHLGGLLFGFILLRGQSLIKRL